MTKITETQIRDKLDRLAEEAVIGLLSEVKSKLLDRKKQSKGGHGHLTGLTKTNKKASIRAQRDEEVLDESIPIGMEDYVKKHKAQYFKKWGPEMGLKKLVGAARRLAKAKANNLTPPKTTKI